MSAEREMTTYRRADGAEIYGEFSWVTDLDFLTEADHDDPTEYVEERWVLASSRSLWYGPPVVCVECGESRDYMTAGAICCDAGARVEAGTATKETQP